MSDLSGQHCQPGPWRVSTRPLLVLKFITGSVTYDSQGMGTVAPDTTKGCENTGGLGHSLKLGGDFKLMLSHAAAEAIQN